MKKVNVKKEILVVLFIAVAVIAISSKTFATGTSESPIQIPTINTTTNSVVTSTNTTNTTNTTAVNVLTPATTTDTTSSTYKNTTLPQTGESSDYIIFTLIVVAIVVAVYAYKKIREYDI